MARIHRSFLVNHRDDSCQSWMIFIFCCVFALAVIMPLSFARAQSAICENLVRQLENARLTKEKQKRKEFREIELALHQQQFEIDNLNRRARSLRCSGQSFFLFGNQQHPECRQLRRQVRIMRNDLKKLEEERSRFSRNSQYRLSPNERQLIFNLEARECENAEQYTALLDQESQSRQSGASFFDRLFNNNSASQNYNETIIEQDKASQGTYRTMCVRSCDGYYFPVSFSTSTDNFAEDAERCQAMCPASNAGLYIYFNPGESVEQMRHFETETPYSDLPNAFAYRHNYNAACSCGVESHAVTAVSQTGLSGIEEDVREEEGLSSYGEGGVLESELPPISTAHIRQFPVAPAQQASEGNANSGYNSFILPKIKPPLGDDPDTVFNDIYGLNPVALLKARLASTNKNKNGYKASVRKVGPQFSHNQ